MPPVFVFMLTRNDRTIPDAFARLEEALEAGVRHIGFKDVGLPIADLARLADRIRAAGGRTYLEVVSLDEASEVASARSAVTLKVDVLMGGTRPAAVMPVIAGSGIEYFPFPGRIVGHPSALTGTADEIVESAKALAAMDGVHGLDLLAYRYTGDVETLISRVCASVAKPVVVAGSIDRADRIQVVASAGAWGFTVGTAALNGAFDPDRAALRRQLAAIQACVAGTEQRRPPASAAAKASLSSR